MSRPKVLFILGNHNHNTMLHQVARALPDVDARFTPFYVDRGSFLDVVRRARLLEWVPFGYKFREQCIAYCEANGLPLDVEGARGDYDLVVSCSDLVVQQNILGKRLVCVQEGMVDPKLFWYRMRERFPTLPRWAAGTACTGQSGLYDKYCVASAGYVDEFASRGAPRHRLVVTGLPRFDSFAAYVQKGHALEGHVLACTSDGRECLRPDDRQAFIKNVKSLAKGRPIAFKFHPNEKLDRATSEVRALIPEATFITEGHGEALAANCEVLVTEWSTLAFVGLALGKETHSYRSLDELRALLPEQNGRAAENIANVCREQLGLPLVGAAPAHAHASQHDVRSAPARLQEVG